MTHTPGPWTYRDHLVMAGEAQIAMIHHVIDNPGKVEGNGRLIAAAPDLLAALREIETWLLHERAAGAQAALRRARAAIDKAESGPLGWQEVEA